MSKYYASKPKALLCDFCKKELYGLCFGRVNVMMRHIPNDDVGHFVIDVCPGCWCDYIMEAYEQDIGCKREPVFNSPPYTSGFRIKLPEGYDPIRAYVDCWSGWLHNDIATLRERMHPVCYIINAQIVPELGG